ncbi:ABC transporter substrate-binding protein [Campylobacter hyointestinalis]|uniref:ABC transporter substrate-binding protein n=1 Tax=Campylobacter hyointestinalis subsp. lawsonii TaxID=91353 RepID=A0AAV6EHV2_CAMHY|nr:ABC transporter substrate-binding protein [Campylobacter hyointestinalis]KAB0614458.1 ABC transporter substrate-binding protein [Campylobacter hyointestinalis subsp. lawsonii]QKF70210.1 nitrate/sulfonate/bicarbonate ABC transporter, periplasmic substrate-binding protein [Campylobacter hyointestinalis subsp. lawsonii]RAZ27151.1 ABC transporter substrate-binding protein [Campylobacter hyointestinalis subsp. lawsonii]
MRRRDFLGFSAALGVSAYAPSLFAKENLTIYGAPAMPSVMIAVALINGKLKDQMDLNLQIWNNPDILRAGVASGAYKVMMSPTNVGVNLKNQGQNIAQLNILTNGLQNLLTKDKNVKELGELEGKKLIMPFKNDMPDLVFQALCKKQGVNLDKISISYTPTPPEAMLGFLTKDFDAALLPEPAATACIMRAKQLGVAVQRGLDMHKIWGKSFGVKDIIPQAGMIVNLDFYEQNISVFETLHTDLRNALEWTMQNRQSAGEIGENYLSAKAPILSAAIEYSNLTVIKAKEAKDDLMKFYEVILELNPKLLGGKLPDKSFFL